MTKTWVPQKVQQPREALSRCLLTPPADSRSFLIHNKDHNKCVRAVSVTSLTVARCDPKDPEQLFRWTSGSRVLSTFLHMCLGATEIKDFAKVLPLPCDEKSKLQQWQCKNETLFGLVGENFHFNWGHNNEKNIMIHWGDGLWSRWKIYGGLDLCSKGYQGRPHLLEPAGSR